MTNFIYPEVAEFKVICRTSDCSNADHEIVIFANAEEPFVTCGVCGNQITDIQPK